LRTARAVALSLGGAQAVLGLLAIVAVNGGSNALIFSVLLYVIGVGTTITLLDGRPGQAATDLQHGADPTRLGFREAWSRPANDPRRWLDLLALVLPVLVGLTAGLSLFANGFYDPSTWVPAALVTLTLLVGAALAQPALLTREAWIALLGLGGLAVLAMVSALWADSIANALVEANRLIFYACLLGTLLLLVRDARAAVFALGGLAGGLLIVGLWLTLRLVLGQAEDILLTGRLNEPLGYINVQGGILFMGVFPLLALGERHPRAAARAAAVAGATLLTGLAFMSQSRGVLVAGAVAGLAVVLLAPGRERRLMLLLTVAAGVGAAVPALMHLYHDGAGGHPSAGASTTAGVVLLLAAAAAGAVWAFATAFLERRPASLSAGVRRGLRFAGAGLVVLVLLGGAIKAGSIADRVDRQYHAFVDLEIADQGETSGSRLFSGGGNRYDYWRVAIKAFGQHPLEGVGAGNYEQPYFKYRKTTEAVQQPHSLEMQVLSELGIVGVLLLLAALAPIVVAVVRRVRAARGARLESGLLLAATGVACTWFIQASVDWVHLIPGATIGALVAAAVILRPSAAVPVAEPSPAARSARRPVALRALATASLGVFIVVGGLSLARQFLSERYQDQASTALAEDRPRDAITAADRALRIDKETVRSYYLKAAALARFNEPAAAQAVLAQAARVELGNYLTYALMGDLTVRRGDPELSRVYYGYAQVLNPLDDSAPEGVSPAPVARPPIGD
jgi:O-antigen ligase